MAGINVNGIGRNPYADSYLTSAKNRSNTTSKDTFVNAMNKADGSKNSAGTSNVKYPGDVTIEYPPRTSQIANLPEQTRKTLMANLEGATQRGSVVQSASNKELASTIKNLFQNVDMKDEKALNAAMKQYREVMTPVYQASGIRNTANNNSLTNVLDQDISRFVKQIANANAVTGNVGSTFNYTI